MCHQKQKVNVQKNSKYQYDTLTIAIVGACIVINCLNSDEVTNKLSCIASHNHVILNGLMSEGVMNDTSAFR